MIITARFATGTVTHAAEFGKIACGAGVSRAAGTGVTKVHRAIQVEGEVTCKRCLKMVAQGCLKMVAQGWSAIEAPAAPAVQTEAPAEKTTAVTCWNCDERITGTVAEIKEHTRACVSGH